MNKENAKQYIPLLEALADGELEILSRDGSTWGPCLEPVFSYEPDRYRRRPKPLEGWMNIYTDGKTGNIWPTKELAVANAWSNVDKTIRVREVIE